jgi:transposase InsO family protein
VHSCSWPGRVVATGHNPPAPAEEALQADVLSLARRHRRYGYRRITALLRRQGRPVHAKSIYRIWQRAGLALPRTRPRRRHKGPMAERPQRAARPNHVWTSDFLFDRTEAIFRSIEEARVVIAGWRWEYNHRRPHSSLGYRTPAERALHAGDDAPSALDSGTLNATEACQGHRLNFSLDRMALS